MCLHGAGCLFGLYQAKMLLVVAPGLSTDAAVAAYFASGTGYWGLHSLRGLLLAAPAHTINHLFLFLVGCHTTRCQVPCVWPGCCGLALQEPPASFHAGLQDQAFSQAAFPVAAFCVVTFAPIPAHELVALHVALVLHRGWCLQAFPSV